MFSKKSENEGLDGARKWLTVVVDRRIMLLTVRPLGALLRHKMCVTLLPL